LDQFLGKRVNLDETGVDGAVESTEFRHETDVSLTDGFVGVGAEYTAGDGAAESDAGTEVVD
jgi:hypothetical protein